MNSNDSNDKLCYWNDSKAPVEKIKGSRCFDKYKATIKDTPLYCPFDPNNGEYMWMVENL